MSGDMSRFSHRLRVRGIPHGASSRSPDIHARSGSASPLVSDDTMPCNLAIPQRFKRRIRPSLRGRWKAERRDRGNGELHLAVYAGMTREYNAEVESRAQSPTRPSSIKRSSTNAKKHTGAAPAHYGRVVGARALPEATPSS